MSNDDPMTSAATEYLTRPELISRDESIAWYARMPSDVAAVRHAAFVAGWNAAMEHVRERDIKAMTE